MRRAVIAAIAAISLMLGASVASAHGGRETGWSGAGQGSRAAVAGTIVSVNATNGTFVANAYVLTRPSFIGAGGQGRGPGDRGPARGRGQHGFTRDWQSSGSTSQSSGSTPSTPTTTQVTISTNSGTKIWVNGRPSSAGDLAAGDRFVALYSGSPSDAIQSLTASPALAVSARAPRQSRQLYAFVGTVQNVTSSASGGTLTATIADSNPSGIFSSPATFTVDPNTVILGSSSGSGLRGGSVSSISDGDTIVGAVLAPAGETATQVEAQALSFVLDFPASSGSPSPTGKAAALKSTLHLFGIKASKSKSHHSTKHHKKK